MLNITLRYVDADRDSVLAYAPEPRIAAVLLFSQEMTARGEADMGRMTHELIERVLQLGGTYYLPYRPHASLDQLLRGYPRAQEFAVKKREVDRDLRFRTLFGIGISGVCECEEAIGLRLGPDTLTRRLVLRTFDLTFDL